MGIHVGLDIGIASVGWCVIDNEEKRILGMGVRAFDKAEDAKTGASLALPRRLARSARRRTRRRRIRMERLRELIVASGMLTPETLERAFVATPESPTPYELRVAGLDLCLTETEWARVLSHLCKRRGYKSMKLGEEKDGDEGAVKHAIAENRALMAEKGYRTAGEMLWRDERFLESRRNKGDYKGVVSRELLLDEVRLLFEAQRDHGSRFADAKFEAALMEILTWQAPITEGPALRAKVGACALDQKNPRIPVACPTFERFRIIDKLHNVRYTTDGDGTRLGLTHEQRQTLITKAFTEWTPLDYSKVRKVCGLPPDARFVGVRYSRTDPDDLSAEKKEKLPHPKAWHAMRKAVRGTSPEAWDGLTEDPGLLDAVADVLTYYKYDESILRELYALGIEQAAAAALASLRFSKNGHLSRQTLLAILPFMEDGSPYSDACLAAGFHHSRRADGERHPKLPAFPADDVRNPVVRRALAQSRKVLNAIIDTFGPIEELHVELGRDVAKSAEERRKIEKRQKENRAERESVSEDLRTLYGQDDPRPLDRVKYRLWREQGGRCPYSGVAIDAARMLCGEPGVAEVDHILPHARSFDDGYMNKVLVTATENQRKKGKIPYEYLGGDPARWHEFEERVRSMHLSRPKQERLLRKDFDDRASDEFRDRNLTDMQYTARYFKDFVERSLQFAGDRKRPVLTVNGRATAYLRTAWRLQKVREDGDLHHALDAAVIAATDRSMVQQVSNFHSLPKNRDGVRFDPRTGEVIESKHVPAPWEGFAQQVESRVAASFSEDPLADLEDSGVDPKPMLVSRMPRRSIRGEVHKETVRRVEGEDESGRIRTSKRMKLEELDVRKLERMVGRGVDVELYRALKTRLEAHGGDGTKAFADPFYKPTRPGRVAPRVRAIRVYDDPSSGGTEVRGGFADNGEMVRTDVFEKEGKYYLVPIYLKDIGTEELPNRAIASGKAEKYWRVMDDSYRFAFSLYMNDLVRLVKKNGEGTDTWFGYYKGADRSTGAISIEGHDASWRKRGLGVAQRVVAFDKFEVDVLGRSVHRVRREKRRGFSNGRDLQ